MARADIELRSLEHRVEISVTVTSEFKARRWIAEKLIQLAAWVLQANIEIKGS